MQFGIKNQKLCLGVNEGGFICYQAQEAPKDGAEEEIQEGECNLFPSKAVHCSIGVSRAQFLALQKEDPYFKNVFLASEARGRYLDPQEAIEWMAKKAGIEEAKELHYTSKNYVISEDGTLWYLDRGLKVCIPEGGVVLLRLEGDGIPIEVSWRKFFVHLAHEWCVHATASRAMHFLHLMKAHWPGSYETVKNYIDNCVLCTAAWGRPDIVIVYEPERYVLPFQCLYLGHVGPFRTTSRGYKYLLTVVDSLLGWGWVIPTKGKGLNAVFLEVGFPEILRSDRGFAGKDLADLCAKISLRQKFGSAYRPQAQWPVENPHKEINLGLLISVQVEDKDWDLLCQHLQFVWRRAGVQRQSLNGISPFRALYGFEPVLPPALLFESGPKKKLDAAEYADRMLHHLRELRENLAAARLQNSEKSKRRQIRKHGVKQPGHLQAGDYGQIITPDGNFQNKASKMILESKILVLAILVLSIVQRPVTQKIL